MIVAIHQPNYIPWLGYFYKIKKSDLFVILDNVQFPKESPAARNFIKGKNGDKVMLSVAVKKSNGAFQNYNELALDYDGKWNTKHLNQIKDAYIKAPFFKRYFPEIEQLLKTRYASLAELNIAFIKWAVEQLKIETPLHIASSFDDGTLGAKNDRNLNICLHFNATEYLSGGGARKYNDEVLYEEHKVKLMYSDFASKEYPQLHGAFIPNLSVLDVLFNVGPETCHLV